MTKISWSKHVEKQLDKLPDVIVRKPRIWVSLVEFSGIQEVRKRPGFHDEPLKGKRAGQRSIRLNNAYRAIYVEGKDGNPELIEVMEINKHEY